MEEKKKNTGKILGIIGGIVGLAVVIILILLLLTRCGGAGTPAISSGELAERLAAPGTDTIVIDDDIVIDGPLVVEGNKTITGKGKITLNTELPGNWPESDAPTWGMGCAKMNPEDATKLGAMVTVNGNLTLDGGITLDANNLGNGILTKGDVTVADATVTGGRYANLVVEKKAEAKLSGGQLLDGNVYNVINYGEVDLTGTNLSGAKGGAVLYTEGTVSQSGGNVEKAAFHNVYVAKGDFTMTGGTNDSASKDAIVIAADGSASVTGGSITNCNHGICNNGALEAGAITLNECGLMNNTGATMNLVGTTVDTSATYCLANNGGTVNAENFTAKGCDTCAVYNFSGDMNLKNLTVTDSRDGNISNAGGNMTVEGATLGVCRDKSITVGNGKAVLSNVKVQGTTNEKYGVYAFGGELILSDSSIENVSSTAVKLDAGSRVELKNITIKDAQQNGFQNDGGKLIANNVSMTNLGSHGIYNNGGEITGTEITIDTVKKNGIQHKSGTTSVNGIELSGTGNHGAYLEKGELSVENGTMTDMGANGFYVPAGDSKLSVEDVTISGTVQQGINNASAVDLRDVTITDSGKNGIYNKEGGKVTINGLKVSDVAEHGINNKSSMTASNVTIKNTGNGSNGIQNNKTMTLSNATISGSKNHGLYNSGSLNAKSVTISGTADNGVYNNKGTAEIVGLTISGTKAQGVNNNSVITLSDVTITDAGKNGVYNSDGTAIITGLTVKSAAEHGVNNVGQITVQGGEISGTGPSKNSFQNSGTAEVSDVTMTGSKNHGVYNNGTFTGSGITISGTAKNGAYNNGGTMTMNGLSVTNPGEHGVNNDNNGVAVLNSPVINGSGTGSNCIQNKADLTLVDAQLLNSQNHGIYNDATVKSQGTLTVKNAAVNGIYNYGGNVTLATTNISGSGEHGVNNTGDLTGVTFNISGVTANGFQNNGVMEVTGSANITASGKHGMFNGKTFTGKNITITGAGDLLMNNAGDAIIHDLDMGGTARKALYNSGYAELYTVDVDGKNIATGNNAEYLLDNNGGILDLTDATVLNAKATALELRGNGSVSVTNVILDHVGNYGIFVEKGSTVYGDGLVINNVTKGIEGAEGIAIKLGGKATMMDHVTLGAYDDAVTGSGKAIDKSVSGLISNGIQVDATTASYSGYDLVIRNTPQTGIYNKGKIFVTDLTIDTAKHGISSRYQGWSTLSGNVNISNITGNPITIYGPEGKDVNQNGVTLTAGSNMLIENAGSHAINNKGSFLAAEDTTLTVRNVKGKNINAINNQKGAAMTLGTVSVDGIQVEITMYNDTTINSNSGNAIMNSGALELNGPVTIQNIFYKPANNKTDNSNGSGLVAKNDGAITGTGPITVIGTKAENIPEGYKGIFNGIFNTKRTIDITGDITISDVQNQGIYVADANAVMKAGNITLTDIGGNGIYVNNASGSLTAKAITVTNAVQHGLNNSGTVTAEVVTMTNVGSSGKQNGINNNGTLTVAGDITIKTAGARGVSNGGTITAANLYIENVGENGIQNNGANGGKGAQIDIAGETVIRNTKSHGIYNGVSGSTRCIANFGSLEIENVAKNGINNAGIFTVSGQISVKNAVAAGVASNWKLKAGSIHVDTVTAGPGINSSGSEFTVTGKTTVKNITGTAINAIHNKNTMILGDVEVDNVKVTVGKDANDKQNLYVGNGIQNDKNLTLNGKVTITNVFTDEKNNTIGAGLVSKIGTTIKGTGSIEITGTALEGFHGINNGIFLDGGADDTVTGAAVDIDGSITVLNAKNQGIYVANHNVTLSCGDITVKNIGGNGLYVNRATSAVNAGNILVDTTGQHGINNNGTINAASISIKNAGTANNHNGINNNGGTLNVTGSITTDNTAGHGVSNNKIFNAASMHISNAGVKGGNGIQNSGSANMKISGDVTISGVTNGHGIYNAKSAAFGSLAIENVSKNGVNNGGTLTVTDELSVKNAVAAGVASNKELTAGSITVDTVSNGPGINSSGTRFTVTGKTSVKNIAGTAINAIHNKNVMTLGDVEVENVQITVGTDAEGKENTYVGNAICNDKTLTLNGTVKVKNIFTDKKNHTLCSSVATKPGTTVNGTGSIEITGASLEGWSGVNHGLFIDGAIIDIDGHITVDNVLTQGIYLANANAKLSCGNISVSNTAGNGIYINNASGVLNAGAITVTNAKQHGISNNGTVTAASVKLTNVGTSGSQNGINNAGTFTVTGSIIIDKAGARGISNTGALSAADITITNTQKNYGLYSKGGSVNATNVTVDGVNNVGVYVEGNATLAVTGTMTVKNITNQGIQLQHANTFTVGTLKLESIAKNGLRLYNNNSNPNVTIGTIEARNIAETIVAAQKTLTDANISVANVYYENCAKLIHGNIKSGVATPVEGIPVPPAESVEEQPAETPTEVPTEETTAPAEEPTSAGVETN